MEGGRWTINFNLEHRLHVKLMFPFCSCSNATCHVSPAPLISSPCQQFSTHTPPSTQS